MTIIDKLMSMVTHDIGIDLGTSTTLIAVKGYGVVINEPSVVAINSQTKKILAVGLEAKRMIGRTPANIIAIKPLDDGVISDFDSTEAMIRYFIYKVYEEYPKMFKITKPRVVIGVPSSTTEVEVRAVIDAARSSGARKVYVIEEAMAAAIGARLPIDDASGSMIVDIGGGTTDIAVISLGGIVVDTTIRIAGNDLDEAILAYAKTKYNILIGLKMAEDVKIAVGSAIPYKNESDIEIKGRDLISGLPRVLKLTSAEVREAMIPVLEKISEAIREAVEQTPPEILADLIDRGITLAGGGALIRNIDKFFEERLRTPIIIAEDPIKAVVNGTETLLDEIDLLERVKLSGEEIL